MTKKIVGGLAVLAIAAVAVVGSHAVDAPGDGETAHGGTVVLLHGLGRNPRAMRRIERTLVDSGYTVANLGYPSKEATPEELIEVIGDQVASCCLEREGDLHFVGHSLGGLLIRGYIEAVRPENLGRVVLLGTPNKGSALADGGASDFFASALLDMAGPTARALGTGSDDFPATLPEPDYPVGVIAGTKSYAMAGRALEGPNDGLVTVESAKLDGMSDFLTLGINHSRLRSDERVLRQVVAFLRDGEFSD